MFILCEGPPPGIWGQSKMHGLQDSESCFWWGVLHDLTSFEFISPVIPACIIGRYRSLQCANWVTWSDSLNQTHGPIKIEFGNPHHKRQNLGFSLDTHHVKAVTCYSWPQMLKLLWRISVVRLIHYNTTLLAGYVSSYKPVTYLEPQLGRLITRHGRPYRIN